VERRGLAIAEVWRGLGDMAEALRTPKPYRNRLAAKVAVARRSWIVTEMPIDVEVSVRDRGIADERLIELTPDLVRIGVRRQVRVDVQAGDVEVIVREQRRVMAIDTARFANEELEAMLCLVADRIALTGDVAIERRIAAHKLSQIGLDGLAVVDQDAI